MTDSKPWYCPHQEHSTGDCNQWCECQERIRNGTYGMPKTERAKAHLATCMERDDFPSHNCACNCDDVSELLAVIASRDARIASLERALNSIVNQDLAWGEYVGLVLSGRLDPLGSHDSTPHNQSAGRDV